jgi:methylenetetrahydrofolate reductase (NADPH)
MSRSFQKDILDPDHFVVTLELVPGSEYKGLALDTVTQIARDALSDGRVSAVTITDNPGGNPSLSPDVIGKEIVDQGMDVIVHFTCRDSNRGGIESRALQLARMGMRDILALTGDYSGKGFGGQGMPVFDIDSTSLICFLKMLEKRIRKEDGPTERFFPGCAVSPFKLTEAETYAQYFKLCKKVGAGAGFVITQVGYDARKFEELIRIQGEFGTTLPSLGSVYVLRPPAARIMNRGRIPGAVVTKRLLNTVLSEWQDKKEGEKAAIERSARLAAILKGMGYRGIHVGGVHKSFSTLARILDRMERIEDRWREFIPEFDFPMENGFYVYERDPETGLSALRSNRLRSRAGGWEKVHYHFMRKVHDLFFNFNSPLEPVIRKFCALIDGTAARNVLMGITEDAAKKILLSCIKCGDCGIQHLAFLCPETQCPKHIRNGQCGGSTRGMCEVYPDRPCVWVRVYNRLALIGKTHELAREFVPPRMWELNKTSSWLNFHLGRDHQTVSCAIARYCTQEQCCPNKQKPAENVTL